MIMKVIIIVITDTWSCIERFLFKKNLITCAVIDHFQALSGLVFFKHIVF